MKYSETTLKKAFAILNDKRLFSLEKSQKRREAIYANHPDLEYLDKELAQTGAKISMAILTLKGDDLKNKIEELKTNNAEILEQRKMLLNHLGLEDNYLEDEFFCKDCEDTGYVNGKMCSCLKKSLEEITYKTMRETSPLSCTDYSFENFSLDYYSKESQGNDISPYEHMSNVYSYCKEYSENFSKNSNSIIMEGRTGLGKTHLSLAISNAVIKKGYGVVYTTAQEMFLNCERERFGKTDDDKNSLEHYCSCDLLVIDDLGSELSTNFTVSVLYNIINQRILYNRPTIISTNLSMGEIVDKYDEKTSSRLMGHFKMFLFMGEDIRLLSKMNKA